MADKKPADRVIAQNKKAFHDYFVDEEFEAGIELLGTEVKSVRAGKINLKDSYVSLKNRRSHIDRHTYKPVRARKYI